jgi:pre-rRNA-processing protein TSR4
LKCHHTNICFTKVKMKISYCRRSCLSLLMPCSSNYFPLSQVYAPTDDNPNAFHRTIYIFLSPDGSSLSSPGAVKAFRCQLPRKNSFYPFDPPKKESRAPPALSTSQLEASLQRDPWKSEEYAAVTAKDKSTKQTTSTAAENNKIDGKNQQESQTQQPVIFTEAELVVEPEPDETGPEKDAQTAALLAKYQHHRETEGEYTEEELPTEIVDSFENSVPEAQQHFALFAAQIAKEPSQVLRYCFEPGAKPLCPAPGGIPEASNVPCCARCGASRRFEFQVMPQLLNHLGVDVADPKAPDWGTIAVYSCSESCSGGAEELPAEAAESSKSSYIEEFVWVQPPV